MTTDPRVLRPDFFRAAEVQALLKQLGWTVALLAQHWGIHKASLHRLIKNDARAPYWDSAFRGLGPCPIVPRRPGRPRADDATAAGRAARHKASRPARRPSAAEAGGSQRHPPTRASVLAQNAHDIADTLARFGRLPADSLPLPSGLQMRGVLQRGQIVRAVDDGEGLTAGLRGVVVEVLRHPTAGERYRVAFEDETVILLLPYRAIDLLENTGDRLDLSGLDLSTDALLRAALRTGRLRF